MSDKKDHLSESAEEKDSEDTLEQCKSGNFIKIFVKSLPGNHVYEIDINETSTVSDMKELLEKQYQLDTSHQILVHHGSQLDDSRTATASGLRNNSTVYLMPKIRAGPLNYKVNTKAVQRFMNKMDEDVKNAVGKIGGDTGFPPKDDDVFMMTLDNKGNLKIVRVTNSVKPIKRDEKDDESNNEIKLETWDRQGENQETRSKMAELQRKMKASREKKKRKRELRAKKRGIKATRKSTQKPIKSSSTKKEVVSDISEKDDLIIKYREIKPPASNLINDFKKQSVMSPNFNDVALWSVSAEDEPSEKLNVPRTKKGDKSYPTMEEYPANKSDSTG